MNVEIFTMVHLVQQITIQICINMSASSPKAPLHPNWIDKWPKEKHTHTQVMAVGGGLKGAKEKGMVL
jgi:hypothetical protein